MALKCYTQKGTRRFLCTVDGQCTLMSIFFKELKTNSKPGLCLAAADLGDS